ncbi:GatB/YqeY domain-containing protein [bacterium]|nr:GatB/YqeY domain-containing protein [bacterium]
MMLFEQISSDIIAAMKAKDKVRLMALRSVKKYFIEAKTAPGANDELSDEKALAIIAKLVKQGKDTASVYAQQSRQDLAKEELDQVAVMEEYLPKQLSVEELRTEISSLIEEVGATSPKDMGRVMGIATKRLSGKAEGKAISEMVKSLLTA